MAEAVREVAAVNDRLEGLPYRLEIIGPRELRYAAKNARYMTPEQFGRLTENVSRDGALMSVPLVYRDDDGKYVVLSGNHRLMAAEAAGVEEFLVLCLREKPDRQTQIAHQLSHNAIVGRDDEQILRELWREIEDLELKMYSGLSSEEVERLDKASYSLISEQRVGFEEISLLFLPEEAERIKEILGGLGRRKAFVGRLSEFGEVLEGVLAVKKNQDVVNTAVAFVVLAEAVRDYLEGRAGLSEGIEEGTGDTVLLHIGATKHRVSKPTASLLRQALGERLKKGLSVDEAVTELCS